MRGLTIPASLILAFAIANAPASNPPATPKVTVAQLEQFLSTTHGLKDGKLAKQLSDMKLTERLSDANEERLAEGLPGKRSRLALVAIADESAFLDLPAAEIPSLPPPDHATQLILTNKAVEFAIHTMKALPNFTATRTTVGFEGTATTVAHDVRDAIVPWEGYDRLMVNGVTNEAVVYRDGREVYENDRGWQAAPRPGWRFVDCGSNFPGEFGEVLGSAALAATQGTVVWSHWEKGASGLLAVFRYAGDLSYRLQIICPSHAVPPPVLIHSSGEIAVNPRDGTVLRVTEMWRWTDDPMGYGNIQEDRDIVVEYGQVLIGGETYLCPVRSSSVVIYPFQQPRAWMDQFERDHNLSGDPLLELVNDITFTNFHVFRAEAHILSGNGEGPATPLAPSAPTNPSSPGLPSAPLKH
jgi:hypothetical protein